MQLLQRRTFSEFFSDTFKFLIENGKHFFLNYFIINGVFLIISLVKSYFTGTGSVFPFFVEGLYILFIFIFSIINWSFVTIYLILYNERGLDFNYQDIIQSFKQQIGKILIFILVCILIAIPLGIVVGLVGFVLTITVVGIALLPLLYAVAVLWISMAFYEYLYTNRPVFDCLGYSFKLMSKKFWSANGSVALFLVVFMIFYIFIMGMAGMFDMFIDMNSPGKTLEATQNFQQTLMSPLYLVLITIISVLGVTLQVNQGIVYFSQKELLENIQANKSIDEIGNLGNENEVKF